MDISELYAIFKSHPTVTTDSRDCPENSIFFALKGPSFDGNKFAAAALEKGCAYAVVDNPDYADNPRCILTDDCLKTLQALAQYHRRQFNIPVIGITGTNGKTTTKELVAAVLAEKFRVLFTAGNFNNDIGVPKTLLRLDENCDIAVVEMGANHPGDIKTLVEIVEPDYGLITNVGRAHLQGFGSFEGVVRTKGELYDFLRRRSGSTTFVNADNEHLTAISHGLPAIVTYSHADGKGAAVVGEVIDCAPMLRFRWRYGTDNAALAESWHEVRTQLIGAYNIDNMLAAITIGTRFDVPADRICHALESYKPSNNRSQLTVTPHNHLVVDAYNANPTSMAAALDNFSLMQVSPKMAVIGEMRELGGVSDEEHRKVVATLERAGFDEVWLVGDAFTHIPCAFRKFHNVEEVKMELCRHKPSGRYILIKGSNGTRLFELVGLL
ncbi:MAG: UDP-N-acetylmuramoyl-tripeptide--D-alanyl-D-alanine ligase [Prevotella sp.]